jgi:hypothetical protein
MALAERIMSSNGAHAIERSAAVPLEYGRPERKIDVLMAYEATVSRIRKRELSTNKPLPPEYQIPDRQALRQAGAFARYLLKKAHASFSCNLLVPILTCAV